MWLPAKPCEKMMRGNLEEVVEVVVSVVDDDELEVEVETPRLEQAFEEEGERNGVIGILNLPPNIRKIGYAPLTTV